MSKLLLMHNCEKRNLEHFFGLFFSENCLVVAEHFLNRRVLRFDGS